MKLDFPQDFARINALIAEAYCVEQGLEVKRKFTDEELAPARAEVKQALSASPHDSSMARDGAFGEGVASQPARSLRIDATRGEAYTPSPDRVATNKR